MNAVSQFDGITITKNGTELFLDSMERSQLLDYLLDGPYHNIFTMRIENADQIECVPCINGGQLLFRSTNKNDRAALLVLSQAAIQRVSEISGATTSQYPSQLRP